MRAKVRLAVFILALAFLAGDARADNPVLTGDVGLDDEFVISLVDASGAKVKHVDAGSYTLVVHDRSRHHNFHLFGPGVNVATDSENIGDQTFTIALVDGTYHFVCDPHSTTMRGTFTVGSVQRRGECVDAPRHVDELRQLLLMPEEQLDAFISKYAPGIDPSSTM